MNDSTSNSLTTRREFIKTSSVAASGLALGVGCRSTPKQESTKAAAAATALTAERAAHAAGSDQIQVALIGCGGRGTGAAANAVATKSGPVKLVAMADVFEDKLNSSYDNIIKDWG